MNYVLYNNAQWTNQQLGGSKVITVINKKLPAYNTKQKRRLVYDCHVIYEYWRKRNSNFKFYDFSSHLA